MFSRHSVLPECREMERAIRPMKLSQLLFDFFQTVAIRGDSIALRALLGSTIFSNLLCSWPLPDRSASNLVRAPKFKFSNHSYYERGLKNSSYLQFERSLA